MLFAHFISTGCWLLRFLSVDGSRAMKYSTNKLSISSSPLWTTTQQLTLCTSFLVIPSTRWLIYTDSLYIFLRLCACLSVYWFTLARHSRSYFVPYQRGRIAPTVLKTNPELISTIFYSFFFQITISFVISSKEKRCKIDVI